MISSAGDALLSVADPSSQNTGHLVNGSFVLPQPLQARARNAANTGTAYNNVGSSASPLNLLTYERPDLQRRVTLEFSQRVNANDAAPHGRVQQDADVHAEHDSAIGGSRARRLAQPQPARRSFVAVRAQRGCRPQRLRDAALAPVVVQPARSSAP